MLQKVYDALSVALPPRWVSLAADVSDVMAVRLGFVGGSDTIFKNRKDLLERFITLRSLYTLTLLRDLSNLKKTSFNASVRLLTSSLQVDLDNAMKIAKIRSDAVHNGLSKEASDEAEQTIAKPHRVATLVPGFDVLQSTLVLLGSDCFKLKFGWLVVRWYCFYFSLCYVLGLILQSCAKKVPRHGPRIGLGF